jgi:cell division protein FtsI (penicillin-binding protein 3)
MRVQSNESPQQEMLRRRLPFVMFGMVIVSVLLLLRVISFQFEDPRVLAEFASLREAGSGYTERIESDRGKIYDRNGNPLAVNTRSYKVSISPNLVSDPARTASQLAAILNRDELELFELLQGNDAFPLGTVEPEVWRQINDLNLYAIPAPGRVQRRLYPQGTLASQVVGFVFDVGEDARGAYGVEAYYHQQLAGQVREHEVSNLPFELPEDLSELQGGADLVLTIDRDIQFLAESELQRAILETGAEGGSIIIMDPRNGDILAMASWPTFDPNAYWEVDPGTWGNPAIGTVYEPGSIFKVITVAAALEADVITPEWTYNDQGIYEIGGIVIRNWDREAHGISDTTQVLVQSLNVGAATIAWEMGLETFYPMLLDFGIGQLTRVDLQGEEAGLMRTPNDMTGEWSESDLGTNSFGQGLSVTPLQMLTAINAIANDGLMMQPRVVYQMIDGDDIYPSRPTTLGRPISAETANIVTEMMVAVVRDGLDASAQVPGYAIAGKTGTAEVSDVVGYLSDQFIMSFVGFLPADDPQVSVLIKLDRPTNGQRWASEVVAPVFSRLTSRLVILMEIPADHIRENLAEEGVSIGEQ